ncbi:MAG: cell division protein SepF [Cyanobacteria bacterium J069]|nr:MAG: cell division protein SepF [Cyanobacteria bacterium J069]
MSFFQRIQDVFGLGEPYDETEYDDLGYAAEDESYGYPDAYAEPASPPPARRRGTAATPHNALPNNVVGMPRAAGQQPEVVLMEPRSFEEIPQAVRALRDRKSVILNLGLMEPDQAQRAADYVAGGAYAVDGHQERLGDHIFLFTPSFVQISSFASMGRADVPLGSLTYAPSPVPKVPPAAPPPWPGNAF